MYTGDLYENHFSTKDIAARLREDLKEFVLRPNRFSVAVPHHTSLDITIKGPNLLDHLHKLTEEGIGLREAAEVAAKRYNYDHNSPDYAGDREPPNFYLEVVLRNMYSQQASLQEAARLKEVYWIVDAETLSETCRSLWYLNAVSPLTEAAFALLQREFHEKKAPKPELNHAVTAEFMQWVEKVKAWEKSPAIQYDRGPKYWRVELNDRVLCFVDGTYGTILKASFRNPQKDSPRGTIFDAINVFGDKRLLEKRQYDWLAHFSTTTGRQFPSFLEAWAYYKSQYKLRKLFEREPTHKEIGIEAMKMDGASFPVLAVCDNSGTPVWA